MQFSLRVAFVLIALLCVELAVFQYVGIEPALMVLVISIAAWRGFQGSFVSHSVAGAVCGLCSYILYVDARAVYLELHGRTPHEYEIESLDAGWHLLSSLFIGTCAGLYIAFIRSRKSFALFRPSAPTPTPGPGNGDKDPETSISPNNA
jgi:hypothetical protein